MRDKHLYAKLQPIYHSGLYTVADISLAFGKKLTDKLRSLPADKKVALVTKLEQILEEVK